MYRLHFFIMGRQMAHLDLSRNPKISEVKFVIPPNVPLNENQKRLYPPKYTLHGSESSLTLLLRLKGKLHVVSEQPDGIFRSHQISLLCHETHAQVHELCNPPAVSSFLQICLHWYQACIMFHPVHY